MSGRFTLNYAIDSVVETVRSAELLALRKRPGNRQADRGDAWRPHLGRVDPGQRGDVSTCAADPRRKPQGNSMSKHIHVRRTLAIDRPSTTQRDADWLGVVPPFDSCSPANAMPTYSIISSARLSTGGGSVRPKALAVVRLTIKSNLVGCATGISPGLIPRKILSTYSAARQNKSGKFGP